jgi:CRISPR-associated protein (TIGR02584 family)
LGANPTLKEQAVRDSPETFPRRILAAVCGLSPQILTETLYALAVAGRPAFIPSEIHLLTTREGAHRASLTLLHPESGQFHKLRRDHSLPEIAFDASHIHIVRGMDDIELDDIRSPSDNERLADYITQAIREYTQDPQAALHVSIAGGRKTMGYYAGYALSLFGRAQDRLSHVLVTPDYEGNPDFYYPTPASQIIYTRENRPLDSAKAEVCLAEIPFIHLREDIPARLLNGQAGFSETIEAARRASAAPCLVIDRAARELSCGGVMVRLPDSLLAFTLWVLVRSVREERPLPKPAKGEEGNSEYATEFMGHYRAIVGELRDTDKTEAALRKGMDENFFQEKISRINTALKEELGERLAQPYRIINRGRRGCTDYGLALAAGQTQII